MDNSAIDDAAAWDRFYRGDGAQATHWSGHPNPTLVAEAAALTPGRALDVGCGEGGDAIWLARRGWQVTGVDPSGIAVGRAEAAARAAEVDVTWVRAGLLDLASDEARGYDLVTAHFAVLKLTEDAAAIDALCRSVAPGGTMLFVHHQQDSTKAAEHGLDPSGYLMPDSLAAHLDADQWDIQILEHRERHRDQLPEGHSPRDLVLRARRR